MSCATIIGMGILDNAKEVANAVHEIKNIELYGRVLDLNSGIMELVEENRKLHADNEDLKKKLHLRREMIFKEPFYYQNGDQTPFCPACWELKNSAIHLIFEFNRKDAIRWDCKVCQNTFMDKKDRSVEMPHRFEPPTSEWR
jgi:regulator of replication initiation timing